VPQFGCCPPSNNVKNSMTRNLLHKGLAVVSSCLLSLPLMFPVTAHAQTQNLGQMLAQTITNTAYASWLHESQPVSLASNTVTLIVNQAPVEISTWVATQSAGTVLTYRTAQCGASAQSLGGSTAQFPEGTITTLASGSQSAAGAGAQTMVVPAGSISIGEAFYFRVTMAQGNTDPAVVDKITVVLTTHSGDRESLQVYETGENTGIFSGSVSTTGIPPQPVQGDCRLSVAAGDQITIEPFAPGTTVAAVTADVTVLADPFGVVFDSEDGTPVDGASVTIIDNATGQPAQVFASDGATNWPSSMVTGQTVTDGRGAVHRLSPGAYSFPKLAIGSYRLVVDPPSGYKAPSSVTAAQLAGLKNSDGQSFVVTAASYGNPLALVNSQAIQVDIPVDRPPLAVGITKIASRSTAQSGDLVYYTITVTNPDKAHGKRGVSVLDSPSTMLRLRRDSVRIDGAEAGNRAVFASDGASMRVTLGDVAAGATHRITYAASVRGGGSGGRAVNNATATDLRGATSTASAVVRIEQDGLTARMTLVGEVTEGGCVAKGPHRGIAGVRVTLEDGSFAITDRQGRYHFDGLVPGTHVAQVMSSTLPEGGKFVDCGGSRSAGSATSRFVIGSGGSLQVANFRAELPAGAINPADAKPVEDKSEQEAAGAETDWLALGDGPVDFLYPAVDHNPRAPAIRVVIRHRAGQTIDLSANGKLVPKVARDSIKYSADRSYGVSVWRGVPLESDETELTALVRNADGSVAATLHRTVFFNQTPFEARLVPERTKLIADGRTRPVVAVKILDRNGRPVHAGLSGELTLSSPYESADSIEGTQSRALAGLGRNAPRWRVLGDDGVALIELAPTMVSGALQLDFAFADAEQRRRQRLESWVNPGNIEWTLVGLAEGTAGKISVADAMERPDFFSSLFGRHARGAFYAKGRVLGKYLLTASFDSAKQSGDQQLLGAIDPRAYYTVYGDGSSRRFDAASRDKLYIRLESRAFYAMFGDVQAGFTQTQLARFERTVTGVKTEATFGGVHLQGFAASTASTHRHDEIAGAGLSGPYPLSSSAILANTDVVTIEVRDRLRPEVVVSRTPLTRFVDYSIDLLSGTITFKQPLLSRDGDLQPQYAVVDYDVDPALASANHMIGAARIDITSKNKQLRVGATVISDRGEQGRTNMVAGDTRVLLGKTTEIRGEGAVSERNGEQSSAWLLEAEHHDRRLDMLAYARSADQTFGVGQTGAANLGHRRMGLDSRLRISENLSFSLSGWLDKGLSTDEAARSLDGKLEYRTMTSQLRLGLGRLEQTLSDGSKGTATLLNAAYTRKMLNNRLEVTGGLSLPLGLSDAAALPSRQTLGLRYSLTSNAKLTGAYELASSSALNTRTARVGIELAPWRDARVSGVVGQQQIAEYGQRSFAAFGLTQSFELAKHVVADASVDSNTVLSGANLDALPTSAKGTVTNSVSGSSTSTLVENFTAVTLGVAWRKDLWSTSLRGEWRDGEFAQRHGLTAGAIRQLGDGKMIGSGVTWAHAQGSNNTTTDVVNATVAMAWRPQYAPWAWLARAEYRSDRVITSAVGSTSATSISSAATGTSFGSTLGAGINAKARRIIASVSADWSPKAHKDEAYVERSEVSLFAAARHNFDAYDGFNLTGTTLMAGVNAHIGIGKKVEIGVQATVREAIGDGTTSYSVGPTIGFVPAKNTLVMVGYNFAGYRDADFSAANNTTQGVFASVRMKFDTSTFGFLGLDKKVRR